MTAATPKTSPTAAPDPSVLAQKLGHVFANPRLLEDALTHPSLADAKSTGAKNAGRKKGGRPYERLEFLGDRVLGLAIAEWLYETFPTANEGEMAKRHAALVNREALRAVAQEIGLGQFVRLARGEDAGAARKNLATLPDAMEAVIGALYLDGGFAAARDFIHRLWQRDIAVSETPADPKTALQEWAQGRGLPLPAYRTIANSGPAHAPKFLIEASVKGFAPVQAEGDSKRAAQKAAAAALLELVKK
ncbi:MAG: ribonuclease III [Alphaproteobacteria bacterium]|nr:ribonuclease III [Alphaproteobacteria bacterium]